MIIFIASCQRRWIFDISELKFLVLIAEGKIEAFSSLVPLHLLVTIAHLDLPKVQFSAIRFMFLLDGWLLVFPAGECHIVFIRTLFENPVLIFFLEYLLSLVYEFEPRFIVLERQRALV